MVCDGSSGAPTRRRHWPEAEKRRMVAEVAAGGRTVTEIARRHGLHGSVLGRWCARYGKAENAPVPSFIPVTVAAPAAPEMAGPPPPVGGMERGSPVIQVLLCNGRRLVAEEGIAPSRLRLLIAAVEGA